MIMSAISRPLISTLGQGIVDASTLISSALNGVQGTGGTLLNNVLGGHSGIGTVSNDEPIPIQQDDNLLNVINALVDHINSEPPKDTTVINENDEMNLLDEIVNEAVLNDVNGVEEIPLYLLLL